MQLFFTKNRVIIFSLYIVLSTFMFSCSSKEHHSSADITIKVQLDTNYNSWVYLQRISPNRTYTIDSVFVDKAKYFSLKTKAIQSPDIYIVRFSPKQAISLILFKDQSVKVHIKSLGKPLKYTLSASPDSQWMKDINNQINRHIYQFDSIYSTYSKLSNQQRSVLRNQTDSLLRQNQLQLYQGLKHQIKKHPSSLTSIMGLYSNFGNIHILNIKYDLNLFKEVADSLKALYPTNTHVKALVAQVQKQEIIKSTISKREELLSVGNHFPNLCFYSLADSIYCLKDCHANYKLIYLWRAQDKKFWDINPQLTALYKKYNRATFEVIAISAEKDKLSWANYCRMERFKWINLIIEPPQIPQIDPEEVFPRLYLLDKNFTILAKNPDVKTIETIINKR